MQSIPIDISASGDNVVIAADPSGRAIAVRGFLLVADDAVTVQFVGGTVDPTSLAGPMSAVAGIPLQAMPGNSIDPPTLFRTAPGAALNIRLGASVQLGGFLLFDLV